MNSVLLAQLAVWTRTIKPSRFKSSPVSGTHSCASRKSYSKQVLLSLLMTLQSLVIHHFARCFLVGGASSTLLPFPTLFFIFIQEIDVMYFSEIIFIICYQDLPWYRRFILVRFQYMYVLFNVYQETAIMVLILSKSAKCLMPPWFICNGILINEFVVIVCPLEGLSVDWMKLAETEIWSYCYLASFNPCRWAVMWCEYDVNRLSITCSILSNEIKCPLS